MRQRTEDIKHYISVGRETLRWSLKYVGTRHIRVTSGIPWQIVDDNISPEEIEAEMRAWPQSRAGKCRGRRWGTAMLSMRRHRTIRSAIEQGD